MPEIVDYDLYGVPPRWLFLRLETSDGRVGWGEPVVEGRAETVRTAVEELLETYLLGEDPAHIEDHWQAMYRGGFYRGGPVLMSAIAGVDQALWDLKGKEHGTPVYDLLGGKARDRVRVYRWIGGDRPADVAEQASEAAAAGLTAIKMNATSEFRRLETPAAVDAAVDRVAAIREACGDEFDIAVDFHGRVSKPMAKRLAAAMEPYDPFFIEEPVLPEHLDALPAVAEKTTTPIATGERLFTRQDFKPVLESGAVDVIQPDLSHAGGITECKKIADMAAAYDVALAPHCPLGPIALASSLQLDTVCHNAVIQEQSIGIHYNESADVADYIDGDSPFDYEDGYVDTLDDPGLGVSIDEDAVVAAAGEVDWHSPVWRHDDGSVAEW
jgi:galactonate dehydratase